MEATKLIENPLWNKKVVSFTGYYISPGKKILLYEADSPGILRYAHIITDSPDILLELNFYEKDGTIMNVPISPRYLLEGGAEKSWSSMIDINVYDDIGNIYSMEFKRQEQVFTKKSNAYITNLTNKQHKIIEFVAELWVYNEVQMPFRQPEVIIENTTQQSDIRTQNMLLSKIYEALKNITTA